MELRRQGGIFLLAVVVVALIGYGMWSHPVAVDMVTVKRAPLRVTVDEEGRTRVSDRYVLSAPVVGYARRIDFHVGDAVAQGQTLVELEPMRSTVLDPRSRAEAEARVAAARSALRVAQEKSHAAKAEAEFAEAEYNRKVKLCERDCIVSEEEKERARSLMRSARATQRSAEFAVEVARFELNAAQTALHHSAAADVGTPAETVAIRSPINGRILKVLRESEGVVDPGQPLIEIGDPGALEVVVEVLSADAVRIHPGTTVVFERWGGEADLPGKVRVVEPAGFTKVSALGIEEQRVIVVADITAPRQQWQQLGDGYRVEARFVLWQGESVLQLPTSALFRQGDAWAAFVVQDGVAELRQLSIGHQNGLQAEVLAGVEAGEKVVNHPDDAITDGSRVRLR